MRRTPLEEGVAAASAGDYAKANAIAAALFSRNPNDVHALQILGFIAFREGRNTDALKAFLRANEVEPGRPTILYWLGVLFKERGNYEESERALLDAVRRDPGYGEAWCQLGETLYYLHRRDDARGAFERALALEPDSPVVLAKAARFFEITHDLPRARSLAEKALALNPEDKHVAIALVEIELREKKFDAVIERATALLEENPRNLRNQARLRHSIAAAQDRLGDYTAAFASYAEAHRLQAFLDLDTARLIPSPLHTENLDRLIRFLQRQDFAEWSRPSPLDGPTPVFLLGFVRSGTTWLDQILSSHPDFAVMEEEDNFVEFWRRFIISDEGLSRLPELAREEVNAGRAGYWTRANKTLKGRTARWTVDKTPLNTAQLPIIYRLFPEAKIVFVLRDPRDAVFSAFQQLFQMNAGMSHFLDLKTGAQFYDRIMTIGSLMRENAPLNVHEIRYEDLVADFEAAIRRVLAFLDVPWSDAVRDYALTAKNRAIRTPSFRQVIEAPYATSIGKWRRYREAMAPALPILAPWVEKFGYDRD